MEFILGFILTVALLYIVVRYVAPFLLHLLMKRLAERSMSQQARGTGRREHRGRAASTRQEPPVKPGEKLDMKDIAKKKFEKDQGEYVDFQEEIHDK